MHQQSRRLLRGVHPLFRQSSPWNEYFRRDRKLVLNIPWSARRAYPNRNPANPSQYPTDCINRKTNILSGGCSHSSPRFGG